MAKSSGGGGRVGRGINAIGIRQTITLTPAQLKAPSSAWGAPGSRDATLARAARDSVKNNRDLYVSSNYTGWHIENTKPHFSSDEYFHVHGNTIDFYGRKQ